MKSHGLRALALMAGCRQFRAPGENARVNSERIKKREYLRLLCGVERRVTPGHARGLAGVALDGLRQGEGEPVVHEPVARAQAPERRGAYLVRRRGVLRRVEDGDAVARPDVVQEEVAVGVDDLIAE